MLRVSADEVIVVDCVHIVENITSKLTITSYFHYSLIVSSFYLLFILRHSETVMVCHYFLCFLFIRYFSFKSHAFPPQSSNDSYMLFFSVLIKTNFSAYISLFLPRLTIKTYIFNVIMTVRVVSYNLLVPIYANQPEYYYKCNPQFLQTEYRWKLIQSQLEQEITQNENTVICLQELSLTLLPKLELFFRRLNYSFFHNLYGYGPNDYMGVGIAIPVSMQLNNMSIIKLGDYIRSISKKREKEEEEHDYTMETSSEIAPDPWEVSRERYNTLVCLQIVIDGKSLWIGTYHMPCCYTEPAVMAIHSSIVKDLMFQLAAGQDFIFAGDFNIAPTDSCYKALIEKDYINVNYPKSSTYEISYQPNAEQILKSAYREKNGTEPLYTNFVDTSSSWRYCDTLDYIFFVGRLTVEKVLELPDDPTGQSYPDETHPSDHLMIAATFKLL